MTIFQVYGPFKVPCRKARGGRLLDEDQFSAFWKTNDCGQDVGVYVFAIRSSQGACQPWYVGMTIRSFKNECFTDRNIRKYQESIIEKGHGTPIMFFLCQTGSSKTARRAIEDLEDNVINQAFLVNDRLKNDRQIRRPLFEIRSLGTPGKNPKPLAAYLRMLGA